MTNRGRVIGLSAAAPPFSATVQQAVGGIRLKDPQPI
jgi:hypothetical protein